MGEDRAIRMVWHERLVRAFLALYASNQDWVDARILTKTLWSEGILNKFFDTEQTAYKNVIRYLSSLQINGWLIQYKPIGSEPPYRNLYKPSEAGLNKFNSELR